MTQSRAELTPLVFNRVDVGFVDATAIVRPLPVTVIHGDLCVTSGG